MKFLLADLDLDPHEHATEELRGDREVVMTALGQNGFSVFQATNQITCAGCSGITPISVDWLEGISPLCKELHSGLLSL